jgi:hypothetical protein
MIRPTTVAMAFVAVSGTALAAQQSQQQTPRPPQPPPTYETAIANTWKNLHNKILTMAKDTVYPDNKLDFKPHPDSRSVLDEFRHVTIGLEMTTAMLKGEPFDYAAREKADASKPKTRASVVTEMEAAIAASFPLVEKQPSPRLITWVDHQAEHYGKLVSNYRMVGIVPPISRPK